MSSFVNLQMSMREMPNMDEIKQFSLNANATIKVGFLSGRQHVETKHKAKDGQYRESDGSSATFKAIETAELAKQLSFGTATTPARPFIEDALRQNNEKLSAEIEKQVASVKNGNVANWDKVGTMAVGAIQEFVRGDYYKSTAPNAPATIKQKGSDTPLIDGADLVNSCEYVIEG